MAQQTAASASQLRALSFRISSTPPKQLPNVAAQISGSIWNCRDLLSTPSDAKQTTEASTTVHRFKTQLSTLLQDRTIEGRWAAVVLVKATIEAGGAEVLSKSNPWVRNLLGILKKPDPPTTRNLAAITLTRIFMLTWDYSNLVREITTPALTAFVPTCLANVENKRCSASELQTVLEAFAALLPRHPTIFRSNESKLRSILHRILAATASDFETSTHYTKLHKEAARRLYTLLHYCAPKQTGGEKWDETVKSAVHATHSACDRVFRAVQEEWQSEAGIEPSIPGHLRSSGEVESESDDAIGLRPWKGVYAGGERIVSLLGLINSHIATATSHGVSIRLGLLADLLTRLFGVQMPLPGKSDNVKLNNQVSKDERETLFAVLPNIHTAAIQLTITLLQRFGNAATPWTHSFLDQTIALFRAEKADVGVRTASYEVLVAIVEFIGPSMSKSECTELEQVLRRCCDEILPKSETNAQSTSKANSTTSSVKQQLGLAGSETTSTHPTNFEKVHSAARKLLHTALARIEASCIPPKLRAQIDRVAVLTNDKEMMFASVMHPPRKANDVRVQASLLPILARQFSDDPEVEALMRPRMPPVFTKGNAPVSNGVEDVEEEEEEMDDAMDEQDDSVPSTGMLDMLTGNRAPAMDGQAEAVAASGDVDASQNHLSNSKRRAEEEADTASSTKRIRASPVAESLMPESMQTLPGPDPGTHQISVPETIVGASQHQPASPFQTSSVVATDTGAAEDDDDDSDMELPPLTMEPDTDPEDEEDV